VGTFSLTLQEVIDLNEPMTPYEALGLDTYPIFDAGYRAALNDKIIAHYNEQEIGHETDSMFRYAMRRKMNEIMPLFNQHYKASQIEIDPLLTVNIKSVAEGSENTTGNESSTTESTSTAGGRVVGSNTPQVRLAGNGDYATSAQDSNSKTEADGTASTNSATENTTANENNTTGYQGNPAELVWALRQTFVNVDMMVIDSLQELFMMVWDNGEEHTKKGYGYDYFPFYPFG
jgi:hypothetical protein